MSDLTDLKFFIGSLIRPLIKEAVAEALQNTQSVAPHPAPDTEPYGDFHWLQGVCTSIPASTLRIKSAAGEIPGVKKVGKRVIYEKAAVLGWLKGLPTRQPAASRSEIEEAAEKQVTNRLDSRRTKQQAL